MRTRMAWLVGIVAVGAGGMAALSLGRGQGHDPAPRAGPPLQPLTASRPAIDLTRLNPLEKEMYHSALGGANWLAHKNGPDGRFEYGFIPSLRVPLEGDNYLRQVAAAFALARAARFLHNEEYENKARHALAVLLMDTEVDPRDPKVRYTSRPSLVVNRLASAGLLVLAISELPSPAADLLEQSEQLCAYIRKQQRADGSLCYGDTPQEAKTRADPDGVNYYPGEALYGLMVSQRHRPAPWKTEVVRKALGFYRTWWRAHKSMALVPWHTAAYTEAYLATGEKAFAEFVTEMNDWLCELQYVELGRLQPLWLGGFMSWADGKAVRLAPDVGSASCAESLAEACRVARQLGDVQRYRRYGEGLVNCLRFLSTLQYSESNTGHFAGWYRPRLLGAFHASHQDGSLRIDYTQHAVCALVQYLTHVVKVGP